MDTSRIIVLSHDGRFVAEIAPREVTRRIRTEELNGEHSLEITTTRRLEKEQRLLTVDATGKWREYVVMREEEGHDDSTYWCPWSLQHDLAVNTVSSMPGLGLLEGATARVALMDAVEGSSWEDGTVTVSKKAAASMYQMSSFQALGVLTDVWGGEIDAQITVDSTGAVTARRVALYSEQGQSTPTRRFDYARDMGGIRRRVDEAPVACRIIPLGKGEQTEGGGYGRKITIERVNGNVAYLRDAEMEPRLRMLDKNGVTYVYPTVYVENGDIEDPQELKEWGLSVLHDYTRPKVTYEASVVQLAAAGMDATGVALGDAVQCVDKEFAGGALRIEGRVTRLVVNELDPSDVQVTIGYMQEGIAGALKQAGTGVKLLKAAVDSLGNATSEYLANLLDHLNEQINANGGFTYILNETGGGIRTYDRVVADPEAGGDANSVVEIKGGSIRIADSKTSGGEWDWKTVFVSGHILAELVTAAAIVAGFIGSPSGNYWNLDTGELRMAATGVTVDGDPLGDYVGGISQDAVSEFVTGDYADDLEEVGRQIDSKAETWYQAGDPSTSWTAAQKAEHVGDLWYKTANGENTTWRWDGSQWVQQDAPKAVFDEIDGKAQIFVGSANPTNYDVGDLWFKSANDDIMTCITAHDTYRSSDWAVRNKYIDSATASSIAGSAVSNYDNALTQMKVLEKLTGGYQNEGMYIQNGHLYIYGSAIKAAGIDASLITTGKVQSANGSVYFDLDNNELACDRIVSTDSGVTTVASVASRRINSVTSQYGLSVSKSSYTDGAVAVVPAQSSSGRGYVMCKNTLRIVSGSYSEGANSARIGLTPAGPNLSQGVYIWCYDSSGNQGAGGLWVELNKSGCNGDFESTGYIYSQGLKVVTTKSRIAATDDYGERLLYCYETPTPMFGDLGSGRIGDDGLCYVDLDPILAETVRADFAYQVFLQKCGEGDLWVEEKAPTHFVVRGTPGLAFDWEMKARQAGYENLRLETEGMEDSDLAGAARLESPEGLYVDYVTGMEQLYADELAA